MNKFLYSDSCRNIGNLINTQLQVGVNQRPWQSPFINTQLQLGVSGHRLRPNRFNGFFTLILALLFLAPAVLAADPITNRFTFSARFSLNIKAKFQDVGSVLPAAPRLTPDGANYNYDDGYILTDVSGNFGGQTWNWGYDDNVAQVSGNTVLLSRSAAVGKSA